MVSSFFLCIVSSFSSITSSFQSHSLLSFSRFLTVFFSFLTFLTLLFPVQPPTAMSALFSLSCLCPTHTICFPSETPLSYSVYFFLALLCPIQSLLSLSYPHWLFFCVFLSEISSSYSQSVSFWHLSVPVSLFFFCVLFSLYLSF